MTTGSPPVFEVFDLAVERGGARILDVPSLSVPEGEILVIIGPNGAGKSTLLQALAGLVKPGRGEIIYKGRKIGSELPLLSFRRRLAMVMQEPLLFDTTVYHNVASGLRLRGMKKKAIAPIVEKTLERFGIQGLKDRSARTLSGGEARRVSIARAFATDPEVLLLDEPFSALDPMIRETLMEDLEQVLRQTRLTTIFVTHDRTEALRFATRLGVMKNGDLIQTGSIHEVMNRPVNPFAASLVGVETILKGRVLRSADGALVASVSGKEISAHGAARPGEAVLICIRPEHVTLSDAAATDSREGGNHFPGRIEKVTAMGFYQKVRLDCGFPLVTYVTRRNPEADTLKEGARVTASFDSRHVHVIGDEETTVSRAG